MPSQNVILFPKMIPNFPEFIPLSVSHKKFIENITNQFPPYSDFNFVSLWCWNLSQKTEVSLLRENIVVRMEDYVTKEIIYMFIGKNETEKTIEELFTFQKEHGLAQELFLIPEDSIKNSFSLLNSKYKISEDRDGFDYVLSVDALTSMSGKKLHQKRKLLNHFKKLYTPKVEILSISDVSAKKIVMNFFDIWKKNKGDYDSANEEIALNNLFSGLGLEKNIFIIVVSLDGKTIGISVIEVLENEFAVGDFLKGDIQYKGIYEFLYQTVANFLKERRIRYYNIEQDLGIEGLRRSKLDYNPDFFLKKYTIKNNE